MSFSEMVNGELLFESLLTGDCLCAPLFRAGCSTFDRSSMVGSI